MININLVIRNGPRVNWRRVGAIALGAVVFAAFGLYTVGWWNDYRQVRAEVANLEPLAATYRKVIAQNGKLKEQETLLQKQEERLAQIGRNQAPFGQADVLQAAFRAAPPTIVVSEAAIDKEHLLLISGQAPDFQTAMAFLRALQALPSLTRVEERKLATAAKGVTTFTFAATVRREGAR